MGSKYEDFTPPHVVHLRGPVTSRPEVVYAKPKSGEVWRVYIGGKIKVRELNSGAIEVATGDNDWSEA
jgi:hypothetical protein